MLIACIANCGNFGNASKIPKKVHIQNPNWAHVQDIKITINEQREMSAH